MNSGLQDAFNLAWKLALVNHGSANSTLLDSYEVERRPIAEMITKSGDATEFAQTLADQSERESRNQAIQAILADPGTRYQEVVAETELNVDYSLSPIVTGDANGNAGPGQHVPGTVSVRRPDGKPCRLQELAHCAGHTLLLLGGPTADEAMLAELHTAFREFAADSPLFEATIALSTHASVSTGEIGILERAGADLLDVRDITLLAVRPDGYIGLRADADYMSALRRYCKIVQTGPS